jgi:hypothetical protein
MRLPYQPKEATMTDRIEATWNVETELGEPPYSQRHSLRVLLGRAVSMVAPSLTQGQSMDEADRMLRASLAAADAKDRRIAELETQNAQAWTDIDTADKRIAELEAALRPAAKRLINIIADVSLWRDIYPDGPDIFEARLGAIKLTVDDVRVARAIRDAISPPKEKEGTAP